MAKTSSILIRIDPETKAGAEQLFSHFGLTVTDAINIFLHHSLMVGGLPFEVKQPRYNLQTEIALQRHGTLPVEKSRRRSILLCMK